MLKDVFEELVTLPNKESPDNQEIVPE